LLNSKNFLEKLQAGNSAAPAVQPDAVQPAAVQAEAVRSDNVPESSKAAAAKEQEHSIKGL